jgi:hypothetical protein
VLFLSKLLGAPISLPVAGVKFVFQQLADLADQELNDEGTVRDQFLLLQVQLEEGDIDEAEYGAQEAVLLARLREIKARTRTAAEEAAVDDEAPAASNESNVRTRRRVVIETPFDE